MFGAKARLAAYLDTISPWATGVENRGWSVSDFENPPSEGHAEWEPIASVYEDRMNPTHVIFPILPYDLTVDRFFLPSKAVAEVFTLNQRISNFNAALARLNDATDRDVRWGFIVMLHTGLIGARGGQGLFEAFRGVWRAIWPR